MYAPADDATRSSNKRDANKTFATRLSRMMKVSAATQDADPETDEEPGAASVDGEDAVAVAADAEVPERLRVFRGQGMKMSVGGFREEHLPHAGLFPGVLRVSVPPRVR